jgi:hypothetical protein
MGNGKETLASVSQVKNHLRDLDIDKRLHEKAENESEY